jgi:hypothetical protein
MELERAQTDYEVCGKGAESYLLEFVIIFKLAKTIFGLIEPIFQSVAGYLSTISFTLTVVNL